MGMLEVNFAGIKLDNPLIVASASTTRSISLLKKAEQCGAGAVILKMVLLNPPKTKRRQVVLVKDKVLIGAGDSRLGVYEAQKLIEQAKKETRLPIIVNTMGEGEDLESWAKLAKALEIAGADMLELNFSCPAIGLTEVLLRENVDPSKREMGAYVGQNPSLSGKITRTVKEAVNIPVMPKMTPEAADMTAVARACVENGADAIAAINLPSALAGVDIYNGGKPITPGLRNQCFGGMAGRWIRPLAFRYIAQLRKTLPDQVPIAGGGGLTDWQSSVQMIMLGSNTLTYCTVLILEGFEVLTSIKEGIINYMNQMGYKQLEDFRGIALKYITTPYELEYIDIIGTVDVEKCNGCGRCLRIGDCEAITPSEDGKITIDPKECRGCAACKFICPREAIDLVERQ